MASLSQAELFCAEILPEVSRTFAVSIAALPADLRDAVRTAYLLCRTVDSIEDAAALDVETRRTLFDELEAVLADDARPAARFEALAAALEGHVAAADVRLCRKVGAPLARFRALPAAQREAIRPSVLEMSRGMRAYVARFETDGGLAIASIADLERYCYFVAGTVGELLTRLFLLAHPQDDERARVLRANEVRFGLGLQLVNVLKDVAEDLERGVCFLPADRLASRGLTPASLLDPARRRDALAMIREIAAIARGHLDAAELWLRTWPASAVAPREFAFVPLVLATGTLRVIEEGGPDVLAAGRTPKVSRAEVASAIANAAIAARDDAALATALGRPDRSASAPTIQA